MKYVNNMTIEWATDGSWAAKAKIDDLKLALLFPRVLTESQF
jgi:hypothetical protein